MKNLYLNFPPFVFTRFKKYFCRSLSLGLMIGIVLVTITFTKSTTLYSQSQSYTYVLEEFGNIMTAINNNHGWQYIV